MPWRPALFKDQKVWVEVDHAGALNTGGGRVAIRYQARPGATVYQAGAGRVVLEPDGAAVELDAGLPAEDRKSAGVGVPAKPGQGVHQKLGKAGERTAEQTALAHDAARRLVTSLLGRAAICFTDGSSLGNPGPAGAGALVWLPDGRKGESCRALGIGTNNIGELTAIHLALDLLDEAHLDKATEVAVLSDSSYVQGVLVRGWKAKANQELINSLKARIMDWSKLTIHWVAGHAGVEGNEHADELANRGAQGATDRRWL